MARIARHVFASGRVQGVAFRWYAFEKATEFGVAGWVRNLEDGRVEVWAEGDDGPMADMLAWLHQGPLHARVEALEVRECEPKGLADFEVHRTGQ